MEPWRPRRGSSANRSGVAAAPAKRLSPVVIPSVKISGAEAPILHFVERAQGFHSGSFRRGDDRQIFPAEMRSVGARSMIFRREAC
jgi:hypothetical protein